MNKNMSNLRIKPHFTVIPHSQDHVELRKGVWNPISFTLQDETGKGKLYQIIKNLDGTNSIADISTQYKIARADIEGVLDQLQQLGVIEQSASTLLDYYIDQACPSVMQRLYPENMSSKKLILMGNNKINNIIKDMLKMYVDENNIIFISDDDPRLTLFTSAGDSWFYDALELESIMQSYAEWKNHFVVFTQSLLQPNVLLKWNMIAHELNISWIHGSIDGPFLFIGPLLYDRSGPCYHCFEKRVSMNLREHASYVKYKNALAAGNIDLRHDVHFQSPLIYLLASHLSLEILNYLATGVGFTRNKVLSIYLPTMEIVFNEILRLSSCPVCGPTEHRDNTQLYFDYQSLFLG